MFSLDLNFLKEDEVETIVSVIEKDFEVKAAEKARICRLRKQLINKDHKAELFSQSPFEGSFCVLCCSKFFIIFNPKRVCDSCGLQICNNCCMFVKKLGHNICLICQQQKDLMAMNCSWFYETFRRKFMEGGSQIVANSLSEYPRKNAISPSILNMVKGAQITKFRHQIEDASSSILDSLRKVECNFSDEEMKSERYTELIMKYSENLKMILHNTSQVLHITLENYNKKINKDHPNIDLQVLLILHDEVELLVGTKIDIKFYHNALKKSKKGYEGIDLRENVEMKLATAIVEKLISDHQQFLIESRNMQYDDLNVVLKDIVKNQSIDFDYDSISQAPSRHGTIRQSFPHPAIPDPLIEDSPPESDDSFKLYNPEGGEKRTSIVAKQWNEVQPSSKFEIEYRIGLGNEYNNNLDFNNEDQIPSAPVRLKRSPSVSRVSDFKDEMKIDSDLITMDIKKNEQSNWLMNAREPFGSLNSLNIESNDPYFNRQSLWKQGEKRQTLPKPPNPDPVIENLHSQPKYSSKFYNLSEVQKSEDMVPKQFNEVRSSIKYERDHQIGLGNSYNDVSNFNDEEPPEVPVRLKRTPSMSSVSGHNKEKKVDFNLTVTEGKNKEQNSLMNNSRQSFGSLNTLNIESNDPFQNKGKPNLDKYGGSEMDITNKYDNEESNKSKNTFTFGSLRSPHIQSDDPYFLTNKNKVKRMPNQRPRSQKTFDEDLEELYFDNKTLLSDTKNLNIDKEYETNLMVTSAIPDSIKNQKPMERTMSQDSGVGLSTQSSSIPTESRFKTKQPETPKRSTTHFIKKLKISKPKIVTIKNKQPEIGSNSSIDSDSNNVSKSKTNIKSIPKGKFK